MLEREQLMELLDMKNDELQGVASHIKELSQTVYPEGALKDAQLDILRSLARRLNKIKEDIADIEGLLED